MILPIFRAVMRNGLALLSAMILGAGSAYAQLSANAPPPSVQFMDPTGVDLSSGQFVLSGATVALGPKGEGLSFAPLQINSNIGNGTPLSGKVYEDDCLGVPACRVMRHALLGSRLIHFEEGGDFTAGFRSPTGEVLTFAQDGSGRYLVTEPSGAVWSFVATGVKASGVYNLGYLSNITYPNGELLSYYYGSNTQTPYNIISNLGIQLHRDVNGSVYIFNMSVDYCAPLAATCSFSRDWPRSLVGSPPSGHIGNTLTDALGRVTTMDQVTGSGLTTLTSPGGVYTKITRSSVTLPFPANNMIAVTKVETAAGSWSYAYAGDQHGKLTSSTVTTPTGAQRSYSSGTDSSAVLTNELGQSVTYTFGTQNPNPALTYHAVKTYLTSVSYPEANSQSWVRDGRANIVTSQATPKPNSGQSAIQASASFDAACGNPKTCNQPNYKLDGRGNRTDYTYDAAHGGVLTATAPPAGLNGVRPQTRYKYTAFYAKYKNASGVLTSFAAPVYKLTETSTCASGAAPSCIGTADETRTTIAYDGASGANNLWPTSVTVAAGDGALSATTTTTYDVFGNVIVTDGPLPGAIDVTRTYYDAARQVVGEIGPDPDGAGPLLHRAQRITYNADGQVTSLETGTATGQAEGSMASFASLQSLNTYYDPQGRKSGESLVVGNVAQTFTQYGYDAANRPICQTVRMNPAAFGSAPWACSLGTAGSDGPDRITYTEYDAANRVTKVTSGYGTSAPYAPRVEKTATYTANGKEQTVADGKGNLTTYEYDGFDRLMKVRYPNASGGGSSTTDYNLYGYDPNGNRTSWRQRDNYTYNFTYDALNRAENGLRGEVYAYDNLGRRTSATHAGNTASATYDALGRIKSETTNGLAMSYQYDLAGNRTWITWPDNYSATYSYDLTGAMTGVWENGALHLAAYAYDNLGRRTATTRQNGAQTYYGYDAASRLSGLTLDLANSAQDQAWTFAYNAAGQVKTRTASNSLYEWWDAQTTKAYGVNGLNQLTSVAGTAIGYGLRGNLANVGSVGYAYDPLSNLIGANTGVTLTYEPTGRLWSVAANGATTQFLYSGSDLVAEYSGSTLLRRYVPGPGTDEPAVWYEGSSTADRRYLLADPQGSIVAVTNGSGALIGGAPNTYDEYGVPAATNQGRFQYTGQAWIPEIGLYHYKARAYSPTLGRFLQTDPIGYGDGLNWYAYVGNDPINHTDSTGMYIDLVVEAVSIGVGTGSAINNFRNGNIGAGVVDSLGVLADGALAVVPLAPGGVGLSIQAARRANAIAVNAANGARREREVAAALRRENPGARIQGQSTLRNSRGEIVRDPKTGQARRIDHAIIQGGKARTVETTSPTAPKAEQLAKEQRIRDAGGDHIRDRETGQLCPVAGVSEVRRCP